MTSIRVTLALLVLFVATLTPPARASARAKTTAKIGMEKPQVEPATWTASLGYSATQDYAEVTTPRRTRNQLFADFGYAATSNFTLGTEFRVTYVTLNGRPQEEASGGYGRATLNYDFGGTYRRRVWTRNELRMSGGVSIPTDEISRFEGIHSIPYLGVGIMTPLYGKIWSMDNRLDYVYIINRFSDSVSGDSNPETSVAYNFGTKVKIGWGFALGLGAGVKTTRYLDDFVGYAYENSQYIAYTNGPFMTALSHANGGYVDKGEVELWYVDKYRRLITWKLGYAF